MDVAVLLLERHGPGCEILDDGPQGGHLVCAENHVVPCQGHDVRSTHNSMSSMMTGAWRRIPRQETRSPLATIVVSQRCSVMRKPVRRAVASPMKLWVDPMSTRVTKVAAHRST